MKKITLLLFFALQLSSGKLISQESFYPIITHQGRFDSIFDRFGRGYLLSNLDMRSGRPIAGGTTINSAPTVTTSTTVKLELA